MHGSSIEKLLQKHGYTLIEAIGKGGYATCYLVRSQKYNATFVCKISEIGETFNVHRKQSLRLSYTMEINALISIIHPNVIKIYEHFIEEKYLFLILEYCSGGSLGKIVNTRVLSDEEIFRYLKQFAMALGYCHSINLVHHDIKPDNLLIDDFGRLKLADFGLACEQNERLCERYAGSMAYLAPEILDKKPYDPFKADVWSFGVSLYQMVSGSLPFYAQTGADLKKIVSTGLYGIPPGTHPLFAKIIKGCLVLAPDKRLTLNDINSLIDDSETARGLFIGRAKSKETFFRSNGSIGSLFAPNLKRNLYVSTRSICLPPLRKE